MEEQILALLLTKKLIDEKTANVIRDLVARGKSLNQAIVGGKYVSDADFSRIRAEVLGLPYVDLTERVISKEILELMPSDIMNSYQVVPTGFENNVLEVAFLNPQDLRGVEAIEFMAHDRGWTLRQVSAPVSQISSLLKKVKGLGAEVATALAQAKGKFEKSGEKNEDIGQLEEIIKGAPVSRMVSVIMRHAVEGGASDIHIEPFGNESRIRYRIDGVLRTSLVLPIYVHPALISRIKVLANLKIDETRTPQDGRITQEINGKKIDFRISTLPVVDNEKVVMRVLDTTSSAPSLERLGYRKEHVALIREEVKKSHGMFLVTGPTGSGKSTTLFAILSLLNAEGVNISTLEDPVEYYIEGVNQSQIRPEIGYTFATGLRALLRQDPNVIMVGEIRDKETGELGVHASLTGHLVFSTLHTNDVYGVVPRMMDMGVEPFLLAATLNIAIAQRLARKICTNCKEPQVMDEKNALSIMSELQQIPKKYFANETLPTMPLTFYHGKGCARCGNSGYQGRISLAELFVYSLNAKRAIEKGFSHDDFQKERLHQGSLSLREDGLLKALDGLTSLEEVFRLSQLTQEDA
ncbi:type II/IV secretion system protein [Candidatus Uhrbacteria bacterium]|nr:type II/IV secretion system protein [Candidatus Uhrbacteria bacterium]